MGDWIYLITNKRNGTIYTGVTNNLVRRTFEHRTGAVEGFTERSDLKRLVWFELHDTMPLANERDKRFKDRHRAWKVCLILEINPEWDDLWDLITT